MKRWAEMTFASFLSPIKTCILSWLTPYIKVWSLVLELIATIILGCKLIERVKNNRTSASLILMGTLLFLFTSASAYNYFQFIYSERFLTFLLALYAYHYCVYLDSGQLRNGRLALLFALFIPFFKDTAVLLAVIPPPRRSSPASLGAMPSRPAWGSTQPSQWIKAYALDIAIVSLAASSFWLRLRFSVHFQALPLMCRATTHIWASQCWHWTFA